MQPGAINQQLKIGTLTLRQIQKSDEEQFIEMMNEEQIRKWYPTVEDFGKKEFRILQEEAAYIWGGKSGVSYVIANEEDLVCGLCGMGTKWAEDTATVYFLVSSNFRKQGIASRVTKELCHWLFYKGFQRIEANVIEGNVGSEAVFKKLGFTREGVKRNEFQPFSPIGIYPMTGIRCNRISYSLLPDELEES